ncbi:MAG: hypothetical protein IJ528_01820 [Bacteroidaceae bacterium]|nr:hypothetical protein [Bacteroidaceae bacterium]
MKRNINIQGKKHTSTTIKALLAMLLLFAAMGVKGQETKLGKPVSGLYNSALTATATDATAAAVVLNDLEDHSWSYYSDPSCPIRSLNPADVQITYYGNGTKTVATSNDANPGNTFTASTNNAVAVGIDASAHTFIYYKTLERSDGATAASVAAATGRCAYTTIPNPFSVRPTYGTGDTRWRGFYAWRVKSVEGGTIYNASTGGSTINVDSTINAETEVYFTPTSATSMKVELEALWARAYVENSTTSLTTYATGANAYERNFHIITSGNGYQKLGDYQQTYGLTISAIYPNGTTNGTEGATVDNITNNYLYGNFTATSDTKFEYVRMYSNNNSINAGGYGLVFGREITGYNNGICVPTIYGNNSNSNINQTVRLESGIYTNFYGIGTDGPRNNITKQHIILGSDYDRANDDDNEKLKITDYIKLIQTSNHSTGTDKVKIFVKSGTFQDNQGSGTAENSNNCFYLWSPSQNNTGTGTRTMIVEGGQLWHIAGGLDCGNNTNSNTLTIRVSGGTIRGSVFGGAARYDTNGYKTFVFTGGTVRGWIAGGSNGYLAEGSYGSGNEHGTVTGRSYVYVGGNTHVGGREDAINMSVGGYVFGAGCGNTNTNTNAGSVTEQTNVVIADNAYVKHGVYGGGAYGSSLGTANVYVMGNATIDGDDDAVQDVIGGVYGGARQKGGGTVNITMKGGTINKGGLFGGSNATGTLSGNVTININGGQVGTPTADANIHGGGYGKATAVNGNVSVALGTEGQTTQGVTLYGDVYGGSALGTVNTNTSNTTTVNLYKGNIYGNAYGGGLGDESTAAIVNGNVAVNLNGAAFGKATIKDDQGNDIVSKGRVFGCNNVNGTPKGTVTVHVYKTAGINGAAKPARNTDVYEVQAVYGGGNLAAYQPTASNTATKVIIDGCGLSSIAYVYGGGNAAPVPATDVTVNGSYEIDYVFGGGNGKDRIQSGGTWEENPGADVGKVNGVSYGTTDPIGTTTTTIYGGVIHHVFGGSNTKGDVTKEANVILGDQNLQTCEFMVDEVYGAGNEAYMNGNANITLNCIEGLTEIYGGSRMADIGSSSERQDVNLTIHGGRYTNVFGGNNLSGRIYGKINVTIQEDGCLPIEIDHLYLGGNKALYSVFGYNDDAGKTPKTSGTSYGDPELYIISATRIGEVYGGGYGEDAIMYGNPHININMEPGEVNGEYEYISSNTEHPDAVSPTEYANYDKTKNTTDTFPLKLSLGNIGTVFGGGNAAKVVGDTYIQIGTGTTIDGAALTRQDAQISGNVYGGGNQAEVTGKTNVVIGHE